MAKMEDVLDVYQRPYDPKRPQVCLDEKPKDLQASVVPDQPEPAIPGVPGREVRRQDYEYKPQGVATIFLAVEPLQGRYWAATSDDRTAATFAHHLKTLVDEVYALADRVVLVTDNLNTHVPWSLYDVFPAPEAKRILDRIEWHYTPEHGSWLNIAEIGLRVLQRQCLGQRFPDSGAIDRELQAWVDGHNRKPTRINWQFTTADARIKLRHLYPVLD
jgi:DDE superfamily endonuclease